MNKKMLSLLLFVSLTFFCNVTLNAQVEHCGIVEYHESAKHLHLIEKTIKPPIPSSSYNVKKIKSRMGKFIVNYDDNYFMTEGVLHCLKLAIDTWEDRIIIKKPINFFVRISEKMDPDLAISTKVGYSRYKVGEFEALPDNLYNQFYKGTNFNDTITINALLNWDSSWQYDNAYSGTINNCYDYCDDTIHVSPMVKGSKVYIDVSLENDYGESGRFMEVGCLYPSAMLNNKKNDIFHVDVKINNNGTENKIKAGDLVTLSLLNDNNIEIDSVEWRIYLKQLNGEDYYCTLSKDKQFSFTNSPGMFNCYFSKPYNKFMQGYNWEDLKEVNPDSCFYACKIYYKEGSDRVSKYICSDFIPFDVLPTDPVISISKIWVPDWADDFPICRIMIDGENYDCGIVMIAEYNNNIGVHVDDIFYEIPDTGLLAYPGHWDNGIYCWTINKYGQAMSSIIKPSTVGVSQEYADNVDLFADDKEVIIKSPNSVDVYIYNINGTLEKVSKNSTMYTTVLNKGVYVIKIFNNNTNKVLTNKICIK